MALAVPVVWSDLHRRHEPGGEVYAGMRTPGTEVPERAERIREALVGAGAPLVPASAHPDEAVLAVHDPRLLEYLAHAWAGWLEAGLDRDPGQDRVVPYLFPHPGLLGSRHPVMPAAPAALAGRFSYDTMTLIGPGTWEAARAAVDTALTAAELVGEADPLAYACCRPPGHHATRTAFGGSCYLNSAAAAAEHLRARGDGPVAVIDVDAHHGNGTQSIFYEEPEVLTASVHVDPAAGWFPHYLGFEDEAGTGPGAGANRNVALAPGTGDEGWLRAVSSVRDWAGTAPVASLVVALGVDAAGGDPESPLEVTIDGYRSAGAILGELGVPTVLVQEGGYDLDAIGPLVAATLEGAERALARGSAARRRRP